MDTLIELHVREAPEHQVLPRATHYDVRVMHLEIPGADADDCVLEIAASTHHE